MMNREFNQQDLSWFSDEICTYMKLLRNVYGWTGYYTYIASIDLDP